MRKIVFLWMALCAMALNAWAEDEVTFTASAPDAVAVGDQFRLSYTVNTRNIKDFRAPSIQGFDVLMGPSRSTSVNIINGDRSESTTFTYILMATKEGEYTIPGATLSAKGNQMISNSVKIKVLPEDKTATNSGGGQGNVSGKSGTSISSNDLFSIIQIVPFSSLWGGVALVFAGAGIFIGVGGSLSAIRQFLFYPRGVGQCPYHVVKHKSQHRKPCPRCNVISYSSHAANVRNLFPTTAPYIAYPCRLQNIFNNISYFTHQNRPSIPTPCTHFLLSTSFP